jgi:N-acetylmuramoyl-L-alanine amidase
MIINKKLIKFNFTPDANTPVYIVVHDTGNFRNGANAEMHYKYFNEGDKQASAHFFVDETQVLQVIEIKDKSWHCGDGKNKYGINNANSIGVEICVNSDGDYAKAVANAEDLVTKLMIDCKIPIEKVVRHYDASRKNCPQTMNNNGDWSKWVTFKNNVLSKYTKLTYVIKYFNDELSISGWAKDQVFKLVELSVFHGDDKGNFNPQQTITKEAMAVVIYNYLKTIGKV